MSLLVVGSVAFDAVETPFGKCEKMLGGSASHFSISMSFFRQKISSVFVKRKAPNIIVHLLSKSYFLLLHSLK